MKLHTPQPPLTDEERQLFRDNAERIARALLGDPVGKVRNRGETELAFGTNNGSLHVVITGPNRGSWIDRDGSGSGDLIGLAMHARHLSSFADAVEVLREIVGRDAPAQPAPRQPTKRRAPSGDTGRYAQQLVDEGRPVPGSPAERYAREVRGHGNLPLPTELRFHPAVRASDAGCSFPALLVIAREDGLVRRVQAIRLDPETGDKAALPKPKRTFGAGFAHVPAEFSARIDGGPTLACEGPEDAITLWSVTGRCTFATLGAGSLDKPNLPAGTRLILCGDNDKGGRESVGRAAARYAAEGCQVWTAFPPADFKDFNALLVAHGPDAVRVAIDAAQPYAPELPPSPKPPRGLPAYYPGPPLPPGKTREQINTEAKARQDALIRSVISDGAKRATIVREIKHRREEEIDPDLPPSEKSKLTRQIKHAVLAKHGLERLPDPRRILLTGSQGTGKTTIGLQAIAAIPAETDAVLWLTEPMLEKAEEAAEDYRKVMTAESMPVLVVRGRGAKDPVNPEETMCRRADTATSVAKAGLSVRKLMCPTCQFEDVCGTRRQDAEIAEMGERGLFIHARNYLHLPSPAPSPDVLIGDEAVTITAIDDSFQITPEDVAEAIKIHGHNLARPILTKLRHALLDPKPLAVLRAAGVTLDDLRFARKTLDDAIEAEDDPEISGDMTDAQIESVLSRRKANKLRALLVLVAAVIREAEVPRDTLNTVFLRTNRKGVRHHHVSRLQPIVATRQDTTVVLLDGTGSPKLNRHPDLFGPKLEHYHIPFHRMANITGTRGKRYSRQSISGEDRHGKPLTTPGAVEAATRLRAELRAIAGRLPGPVMVAASLKAANKLREERITAEPDDVTHFGKNRGRNDWEECPSGLIPGQESVSIQGIEDLARAYLADDPEPFVSCDMAPPADWPYQQWPYRVTRMRRMKDGSLDPVEVDVHPDPRVQEVLEQVREAEVLQTGDRLRPVFNQRTIVFANSLVLDVDYDRILTHAELVAGGTRWDRAWAAKGLIPLGKTDLHRMHPTLFPSVGSAKDALQDFGVRGGVAQIGTFYLGHPPPYTYRRKGQPGADLQILVDPSRYPTPEAARAAVERELQCELAVFIPPGALSQPDPEPPPEPPKPGRERRHGEAPPPSPPVSRLPPTPSSPRAPSPPRAPVRPPELPAVMAGPEDRPPLVAAPLPGRTPPAGWGAGLRHPFSAPRGLPP